MVIILLDHGADIEAKVTSLWTPLHMGAKFGHIDVVRVLLERGANVRAADRLWREPLRLAKSEGHVEVAKLCRSTALGVGGNRFYLLCCLRLGCECHNLSLDYIISHAVVISHSLLRSRSLN